jgi:hypothetical protein
MTPPQMGGEYNPLTGETEPPHYDPHSQHEPLQRDFTSPMGQGSPGTYTHLEYCAIYKRTGSGAESFMCNTLWLILLSFKRIFSYMRKHFSL